MYLTQDFDKARHYACETTKTKNPDYSEPMDLETTLPDPFDVCIYETMLPDSFSLERDDIDPINWRTKNETIPPKYLRLWQKENIATKLDVLVIDLCLEEQEEVEYNLMKLDIDE